MKTIQAVCLTAATAVGALLGNAPAAAPSVGPGKLVQPIAISAPTPIGPVTQATCVCDLIVGFNKNTCVCNIFVTFMNFSPAKCTDMPSCSDIEHQCKVDWDLDWLDPGGVPACVGMAMGTLQAGCTLNNVDNPPCPVGPGGAFGIVSLRCTNCNP
jgi:hypothetical protein